jgi:L-threonylcarbamoyladenylate synthase
MTTERLDARTPESIDAATDRAAELIGKGELVAFPTETVYGLGADAFDAAVIERIYRAKGRPSDNPLIVHLADADDMRRCARTNERAFLLAAALMPGPLTIVLPALDRVPLNARGGLSTVALRVPAHAVALALLRKTGPLVAPSANLSGRPSPTTAEHVASDLDGRIAAILDGGPCRVGIESTVVDLSGESVRILRPGSIAREEIEEVLGYPLEIGRGKNDPESRSPGMKYRHYAPSIPVRLVLAPAVPPERQIGHRRMIITSEWLVESFPGEETRRLDERTLYRNLRDAEILGFDEIVIAAAADELSAGLLDRIRKAAGV